MGVSAGKKQRKIMFVDGKKLLKKFKDMLFIGITWLNSFPSAQMHLQTPITGTTFYSSDILPSHLLAEP